MLELTSFVRTSTLNTTLENPRDGSYGQMY